jgi:hypothetical protein
LPFAAAQAVGRFFERQISAGLAVGAYVVCSYDLPFWVASHLIVAFWDWKLNTF